MLLNLTKWKTLKTKNRFFRVETIDCHKTIKESQKVMMKNTQKRAALGEKDRMQIDTH